MADDQTDATAVLWDAAKAALDDQAKDLDTLRTRATGILSVAALVAGLFGTRLPHLNQSGLHELFLILALASFVLSVTLVVIIVAPRSWVVGAEPGPLIEGVAAGTVSLAQVNLSLAARAHQNWRRNQRTLTFMFELFTALCVLTGFQVVAWALAIL
jgi:hypothetical protein